MNSSYLFTSKRLGFRNWKDRDLKRLSNINANPKVMEYFPSTIDVIQTTAFIERMQAEYAAYGYCYFAVDALENNELIGFIGLSNKTYEADFTPCVDIGWRIDTNYWGKGYATEGAIACLDFGFKNLKLDAIVSTAPKINKKSIRIMEKIGMHFALEFNHPMLLTNDRLKTCVLYRIENNES